MSYLTDRLPNDTAISVAVGLAGAFIGGLLTCLVSMRQFDTQYPHDGQNGLGAVALELLSTFFFGPLTAIVTFLVRYSKYRKQIRLEDEQAFEAELIVLRKSKDEIG